MPIEDKMAQYASLIEAYLDTALLPDESLPYNEVIKAMRYSLLGGGKRIRSLLTLAFCEGLGGDVGAALPAAAAVEMIHAYSLIHDDLPCMDDDDVRRGKPSCHIAFGEATALLAGDALLTMAFEMLSGDNNISLIGCGAAVAQIASLSRASGAAGMVGGQVLDMEPDKGEHKIDRLELTDSLKTGALIKTAAEMGCIAAGADSEIKRIVRDYAGKIGLAFQIMDDILDVCGDAGQMGKKTGRDEKQNKTTYISVLGVEGAHKASDDLHIEAVRKLDELPLKNQFLYDFTDMLRMRTR